MQAIPFVSPVHSNPLFPPSITDRVTLTLHWWNICIFWPVISCIQFTKDPLLQILTNFIRNNFPGFPAIPPSTWVDTIFNINLEVGLKDTVSKLYNTLFMCQPSAWQFTRVCLLLLFLFFLYFVLFTNLSFFYIYISFFVCGCIADTTLLSQYYYYLCQRLPHSTECFLLPRLFSHTCEGLHTVWLLLFLVSKNLTNKSHI